VATVSGRLRICSARSRSPTTTSPGGVALMDIAPVGRNLVGECAKFLFILSLRTLTSDLIGFQTPPARSCNSDSTSDHCAAFPVKGDPRREMRVRIHHLDDLDQLTSVRYRVSRNTVPLEDYKRPTPSATEAS